MNPMKYTKTARKADARGIIERNPLHAPFDAHDTSRLNAILGTDFRTFARKPNQEYPADTAHLHADGAAFSWNKAISPESPRTTVYKGLRAAIAPLMRDFMCETEADCVKCGSQSDLTVDHTPAFKVIADAFLAEHGDPQLENLGIGGGWRLKDADTEAAWVAFHQSRVTLLQVLCRSCNASKGARP